SSRPPAGAACASSPAAPRTGWPQSSHESRATPGTSPSAQIANPPAVPGVLAETCHQPEGELMSAESSLTALAVVRALLNEDTRGLTVLLPDALPEPGR